MRISSSTLLVVIGIVTTAIAQQPAAVLVPALPARPAAAPTPAAEIASDVEASLDDAVAAAAPADDAEAKAKAAKEKRDQERLQKIQQLKFDRRPSVVLKAWSVPFKTLAQIEQEQKEKAAEQGQAEEEPKPEEADGEAAEPTPEQLEAEKAAEEMKQFDESLHLLKHNVTLGNWSDVKEFIGSLDEKEGAAVYKQMLSALQRTPGINPGANQNRRIDPRLIEKNTFTNQDVLDIAAANPKKHDKDSLQGVGGILRFALQAGNDIQDFLVRFNGVIGPEDDESKLITKRQAARILCGSGQAARAGDYLPTLDDATESNDREALNLLAQYFLAVHSQKRKIEHLENAWHATNAALAVEEEVDEDEKNVALRRAVDLAPRVREELGQAWLEESFTSQPERGREILASIGSLAATNPQQRPTDADTRAKGLELQKTAAESLLKVAPERAGEWKQSLNLLALNWLKEAEFAYTDAQSSSSGPMMRRDPFGNIFYFDEEDYYQRQNMNRRSSPIAVAKILEAKPSEAWLAHLDEAYKPPFDIIFAKLYLKVKEEDKSFPYIEKLAQTHRDEARDLAHEFLRVWTQNHNPNSSRYRSSRYLYYYGYESRAERIPLTRSKQQRNLIDLAKFVKRLKGLELGELDEELLANAFTSTHSQAEVYRLESIEDVFGGIDNLKPDTLSELVQRMRANLATVWRAPAVQEQNKTNRKQKDIEEEIVRGYSVTKSVIEKAQAKYPESWALQLARAAILHDENDYQASLAKTSKFSENRQQSFDDFEKAAQLYAQEVAKLPEDEWTTRVYTLWFYAGMGACDLAQINNEKLGDVRQYTKIRESIESLPPEAAKWHMDSFATQLFSRMSGAKPEIKVRYLRAGFDIVGDNERASEARKVFEYYNDLVTEIELQTRVDGTDVVGHGQPFGVFVDLRHTKEIEREAGGFAKYLQNQNSSTRYYYNYGRPLEDYRDKFQEAATAALNEHFEVLSVTFQHENVNSKATSQHGWRVTPYAYILLKARGPEVDKIPPLAINLDFLDTSGYAIIPIESAALPIDARGEEGDPRPMENVVVTQTLDDRDPEKLVLEVKATAQGLVPPLDDLIELKPEEFEVVEIEDEGVAVNQFDEESDETVVNSERLWQVSMNAKEGLEQLPSEFTFGTSNLDGAKFVFQRYVDADLAEVESTVALDQTYGERTWTSAILTMSILAGVVALGIVGLVVLLNREPKKQETRRFAMPEEVTPFTVIGLLKKIHAENGLSRDKKEHLAESIHRLEEHYFDQPNGDEPNLQEVAERWLRQTN